jgi:YesN/AraC family two-component response regulator
MKKFKILLVDDNKHFLKAFRFLLEDTYPDRIDSIDEAMNGRQCLEILEREVIDIVFMDIDMPVMDGVTATKKINEQYRDVKIIAVSFHDEMEHIQQMIEAGARNYLIKEEINRNSLKRVFDS